jgi:phthalate 4,5-dioxygenase oxygenase subunit
MLSKEENELLCRVGPGTPMGELFRQYWLPALPSFEMEEADGRPKRVRLLGENLVAFRDTTGKVGMVAENCPHRGASLFFGRNEEAGLRCVYHGWKFDTAGNCVDMPNEPAESNFKEKVHAIAYPCQEAGGVIWTYMGPLESPPPLPNFEVNTLPADQVFPPRVMLEENNYMQGLEGDIDSSHIDWVHGRLHTDAKPLPGANAGFFTSDKRPRMEVLSTPYGAVYSARRRWHEGDVNWHRITQFVLPFITMIAASQGDFVTARAWVPVDDDYTLQIVMGGKLSGKVTDEERAKARDPFAAAGGFLEATSDPRTRYYTKANLHNDFLIDYEAQKKDFVCGIVFAGNLQDRAMTETMGTIYNRTQEHLGTTDAMVIQVRRTLISAALELRDHGVVPANVLDPNLCRVRPASVLLKDDEDWASATEAARSADAGVPIAYVRPR